MEDITEWIMGSFSGFEVFSEPFGKFWDIDFWSAEALNYMKLWDTTAEDFTKHFADYLELMGWVPKDQHSELIKQYNVLNKRVADQAIEISKQKELLADQKQTIMDQEKEITKQKEFVTDQKELVKALKKEVSGQKNKVSKQKKIVADQKKMITDLKKEASGQIKSIKQLQKQING
jgi:chromosome segregation ATPase